MIITYVATLSNQRLFALRRRKLNEHKRQNIKHIITADIECCIADVATIDCKYLIAEHITISIGYIWQGKFK